MSHLISFLSITFANLNRDLQFRKLEFCWMIHATSRNLGFSRRNFENSVLTNGLEVKLQRNALSVLEAPTGHEDDGHDPEDFFSGRANAEDLAESFQPVGALQKFDSQPRATSRSHVADVSSKELKYAPAELLKVDLSKLEMTALLRYWRHFDLVELGPDPSKEQLVDAVERHFMSQQLNELQVIAGFVQAAKRLKTVYG